MSRFDLSAWGSRHRGVDTLALPDGRVLYNDGHAALVTRETESVTAPKPGKDFTEVVLRWADTSQRERTTSLRDAIVALLPPPLAPKPEAEKCTTCNDTGVVECECCGGSGSLDCSKVGCAREHECSACEGSGETDCEDCEEASLHRDHSPKAVRIAGREFDAKYLSPLRGMGAIATRADGTDERAPLIFNDGETALIVMPLAGAPSSPENVLGDVGGLS